MNSSPLHFPNTELPPLSLVLVTGANGFVGSHCVEVALRAGYRVRGTARRLDTLAALQQRWNELYPDRFEGVEVPEMTAPGAYDRALEGAAGVIHVAGPAGQSPVHPDVFLNSVKELLESCKQTKTVKRFVLTGSSYGAGLQPPGVPQNWGEHQWIDVAASKAKYEQLEPSLARSLLGYGAFKAEAEQVVLAYGQQSDAPFKTATVSFNHTTGPSLEANRSTADSPSRAWITTAFSGDYTIATRATPAWYNDVRDVALVHLAALLSPEAIGHRIWMVTSTYNMLDVLDIFRELFPSRSWAPLGKDPGRTATKIDNALGLKLLRQWGKAPYDLRATIESMVGSEATGAKLPAHVEIGSKASAMFGLSN